MIISLLGLMTALLACGEYGSGRLVDPGEILNQLK